VLYKIQGGEEMTNIEALRKWISDDPRHPGATSISLMWLDEIEAETKRLQESNDFLKSSLKDAREEINNPRPF